ncbi:alpha-L-rhamnosidase N-terminal domain-containing protein, partial [Citricoccus sp.]|uniref:alpha-L-rhamnosidase N-terminal domain-containing protein n=1 Tax=Citricoccus sp. TaxID=1978372 RepID=UPI0028BD703A
MSHQQDQKPQGARPHLGKPEIKRGAGTEPPLPTRRSLRQHRRADSEAGAPAGDLSKATILELPATSISPADVGPLTGQLPRVIYATGEFGDGAYAIKSPDETVPSAGDDTTPADRPALKARRATGAADPAAKGPGTQSTALGTASSADPLPGEVTRGRDGVPVGPDVLSPGWSSYEWRLRYRSYDVTAVITPTSVIGVE